MIVSKHFFVKPVVDCLSRAASCRFATRSTMPSSRPGPRRWWPPSRRILRPNLLRRCRWPRRRPRPPRSLPRRRRTMTWRR